MISAQQNQQKKTAAEAAARLVENGMILGLGTGSTAAFFLHALSIRVVTEQIRVMGIPTSEQTASLAHTLHIPLTSFAEQNRIDLTVDGADEIERGTLFLIKGHGGALLREKIVASASDRMVVIADQTKVVENLGQRESVPVEITPFGWQATLRHLQQHCANLSLRMDSNQKPFVTDGGNYIIDCLFGVIEDPRAVSNQLDHTVGVIEHGLFLGLASEALVAGPEGVTVLRR